MSPEPKIREKMSRRRQASFIMLAFSALLPASTGDEALDDDGFEITDEDRRYWAFQPILRPPSPAVEATTWSRRPGATATT